MLTSRLQACLPFLTMEYPDRVVEHEAIVGGLEVKQISSRYTSLQSRSHHLHIMINARTKLCWYGCSREMGRALQLGRPWSERQGFWHSAMMESPGRKVFVVTRLQSLHLTPQNDSWSWSFLASLLLSVWLLTDCNARSKHLKLPACLPLISERECQWSQKRPIAH